MNYVYEYQYVCVYNLCAVHAVLSPTRRTRGLSSSQMSVRESKEGYSQSLWRDQLVCRSECHVQEEEEEQLTNPSLSGLGTSSQFTLVLFISFCVL